MQQNNMAGSLLAEALQSADSQEPQTVVVSDMDAFTQRLNTIVQVIKQLHAQSCCHAL